MYPFELEIKDTTESNTSASFQDLFVLIWRDGQRHTSIFNKLDDFNLHIIKVPFLSSSIPRSSAYGVFISKVIWYTWTCSSYEYFILRRFSNRFREKWYAKEQMWSSLKKFYDLNGYLIKRYSEDLIICIATPAIKHLNDLTERDFLPM